MPPFKFLNPTIFFVVLSRGAVVVFNVKSFTLGQFCQIFQKIFPFGKYLPANTPYMKAGQIIIKPGFFYQKIPGSAAQYPGRTEKKPFIAERLLDNGSMIIMV